MEVDRLKGLRNLAVDKFIEVDAFLPSEHKIVKDLEWLYYTLLDCIERMEVMNKILNSEKIPVLISSNYHDVEEYYKDENGNCEDGC